MTNKDLRTLCEERKMFSDILVASLAEPFNSDQPAKLIEALFPEQPVNLDARSAVSLKQWLRILEGQNAVGRGVDVTLASEIPTSMLVDDILPADYNAPGMHSCFIKLETLRKSHTGLVQVYRMGRFDLCTSRVYAVEPPQYVVIKVFEMQKAMYTHENPLNEARIMNQVTEPKEMSVVPLYGCMGSADKFYIVCPYVAEGDMFRFLSESPRLSERQIRHILKEMLRGIERCHEKMICHRDISLENFLKQGDELVLIDFGLSTEMQHEGFLVQNHGPIGKTKYMAPELALGKPTEVDGRKLDIFSLGVTLFMLITQTEPFHIALNADDRYRTLITKRMMRSVFASWGFNVSNLLMNLLESMLDPDPFKRPTVTQLINHPWMTEA